MRAIDRILQQWRIRKAIPFVREGDRLLDVGCFDRTLIDRVLARVHSATGVDSEIETTTDGKVSLVQGHFPDDLRPEAGSFDCITALAVLEHVPDPPGFASACFDALAPGGRVVLTVPHAAVDGIIDLLVALRLADGMALEEHHGFDVSEVVPVFTGAGFALHTKRAFQLGLNRLFVFEKGDAPA